MGKGSNTPIAADHSKLKSPSAIPRFPEFYYDVPFACRECGSSEVWTPKQQKWWYEEIGGNIETTAIYCRPCRIKRRLVKEEARRVHLEGLARKGRYT
ncbi:zinc-ribbon domain containing protein [Marinibactrum halimedae]|uniref:zinc-ribbon domain containing protein n=1 Tax=Marinibactrum halimedae TaxID=1444977 RepID=UPI0039F6B9B9